MREDRLFWSRFTQHGALLGAMWTLRVTALRAAGLATLALGVHALRWLIKKDTAEENDSPLVSPSPRQQVKELELSPFKRASMEYSPSVEDPPSTSSRQRSQTMDPSYLSITGKGDGSMTHRDVPKALRFEEPASSSNDDPLQCRNAPAEGSDINSEDSDTPCSRGWGASADGMAHVHTPESQRGDRILGSPKFDFPHIDYEPEMKSPYDLSSTRHTPEDPPQIFTSSPNGHPVRDTGRAGRHSRMPSFPVVDYQPGYRSGFSSSSQADSFDMAPAPTEEGDAIAKVEEVLADLEEQVELGVRRHSRSFSEPNLAARLMQQQQALRTQKHVLRESSEDDDEYPSTRTQPGHAGGPAKPQAEAAKLGSAVYSNGSEPSSSLRAAESAKRSRDDSEVPPLLRLDILSGPASGRDITIDDPSMQVTIGRFTTNTLSIDDNEVSGKHAQLHWDSRSRQWQVRDVGSLNGTRLNGNFISNTIRRPGKIYRLNTDDILLLGSRTAIKVIYLPNALKPDMPHNLKRVYAPPSMLQPTTTLRSEAMASLRAEVSIEKAIHADSLRMEGAVLCRLGVEHQRKGTPCEDVPFWGEPGRYEAALYCIFDGHCGRKTATQCTHLLPEELRKRMSEVRPHLDSGLGAGRVWEEVFLATDAALDTEDGATATAVLVWKDAQGNLCLQTANVGDSAAVFCNSASNPKEQFQKLTADHRISDPDEQKRLADLGIELGKNRTRLYGLNLSRCLGDKFIKGADLGFTAVPSVSMVAKLAPHESGMLVVASDGLWDVAEPGRIMEVAFEAQRHPSSNPETIADAIYQHAMKQRTKDDVCIFVLCFYPEGTLLSEEPKGSPRLQHQ